jgi:hypothetical protein
MEKPPLEGVARRLRGAAATPLRLAGGVLGRAADIVAPAPKGEAPRTRRVAIETDMDTVGQATRLLLTGKMPRLRVTLDDVIPNLIAFTTFDVDIRDVEFDRVTLLRGRAKVRRVGKGTLTAELRPAGLASFVGWAIELSPVKTDVEVRDGGLLLRTRGLPTVRIPVPHELFPGRPTAEIQGGRVRLRASFDELPPPLLRLVNEALSRRTLLGI